MSLCMLSGSARWLQKICGQLLSQRLLHKNGVQNVLRGMFEATVTSESLQQLKRITLCLNISAKSPKTVYMTVLKARHLSGPRLPK